ncbi:glycosyltransferase family 4 protein [Bacillus sp. UNC41MFS5]|uniref:glycosyltransferase family 4 protein n=1 Tax=Bacillus sp. UNC41MFS5 TaxID=1449046 RepID=UPI00047AD6FF|nr:glycosyltransferase family 4 protein [Bacillus sp. UNC41MFS5]
MKAVLLAPLPPPSGGIASWAKRMQTVQLKNDWKVIIVDEKVIGGRDIFGANTRKHLSTEIERCLKIWRDLWRTLDDREVKVVHSNIPAGWTGMLREIVCALISKGRGRKFIIHYRCTIPNMVKGKKNKLVFKILTDISDASIVLNTPSETFVRKYSKKPAYLIPNFVSLTEMNSALSDAKPVGRKLTAVYVGGVTEEKGCLELIEAAKKLRKIEFRLVGSVAPEIHQAEIPENVTLCGEVDRQGVQKELAQADLFLFMSKYYGEGFSNALAEAMVAGLPCVVSDWAANKDMIETNGGFVVPVNDINKLCNAIQVLAGSEELRQKMGRWNIEKVKTYYLQERVTSLYVDLYEEVVKV